MKMKGTNPEADYSLALADIYHNLKPTQKTQVKQPSIPLNEYQHMTPSEQKTMKNVTRSKTLTNNQKQGIIDKAVASVKKRMAGEDKPLSEKEAVKEKRKKQLIARKKSDKEERYAYPLAKVKEADRIYPDADNFKTDL